MTSTADVSQRARRRIAVRLLPLLFIMYTVCYVDRVNVSFANLRMSVDLGFSDRVYGLGVGIFFAGYVLLEIPGAIIVERWSARKWIARIMISWGLVTILTGFVHTPRQFYLARLLVGISEASFFPGIIVYLTHWFRLSDRAKAIGFFYTGVPASSVVGSTVAGWLLGVHWLGLAGWRWLFIMEGVPPILLGIVALVYLTDRPREARWLPEDERIWITQELEAETRSKKKVRDYTIRQAFRDRQVVLLIAGWLFALAAALGALYWMPTFIKRLSHIRDTNVALLGALPGIVGVAGTLLNAWHSDKTGERRWHTALPLMGAGLCYLLLLEFSNQVVVAVVLFSLAAVLYYTFLPVFWAMPTAFLCESAAAACFGLINAVGQMGGVLGPYIVSRLNEKTHGLTASFAFIAVCYFVAASIIMLLSVRSPVLRQALEQPPQERLG